MKATFYIGFFNVIGDYQRTESETASNPKIEKSLDVERVEVNGINIYDELNKIDDYMSEHKCGIFEAIERICLDY